jgi:catechol 2,3-dioxygenase-like lactoylglutathione lyase family enzyme
MPAVAIHHLAFRTRKLARLVRFYQEVVRLELLRESKLPRGGIRSVWLEAGGTILMIERAEEREPRVAKGSLDLVCFAVRDKKALARARTRVQRHVRIEGDTEWTFYFRDPDGRRLGISCFCRQLW